MKIIQNKYTIVALLLVFIMACSTKKNKWVNRNFQSLNTKFNVLYHSDVALEKGVFDLKSQYSDNFWEILPVERLSVIEENTLPGRKSKNANFDRAEEKATKAIQKRSMNIDGKERNSQVDEAYLNLGKPDIMNKDLFRRLRLSIIFWTNIQTATRFFWLKSGEKKQICVLKMTL